MSLENVKEPLPPTPADLSEVANKAADEVAVENDVVSVEDEKVDDIVLPNDLDTRVTKLHVKALFDAGSNVLDGRSLTKGNIIRVAFALMHVAKNMKKTKGSTKKQALLTALDLLIQKDKSMDDEEKDMLFVMVHGIVSQSIDDKYADDQSHPQGCCIIM